jgi:hypothetical protein
VLKMIDAGGDLVGRVYITTVTCPRAESKLGESLCVALLGSRMRSSHYPFSTVSLVP